MLYKMNLKDTKTGITGLFLAACILTYMPVSGQNKKGKPVLPVSVSKDGKLSYTVDEKGNRVPDFSP